MRKVELYVDSKLKQFKLFKYMEEILRNGVAEESEDLSSDEVLALSLYSDFVDLASVLDSYSTWSDKQWSNFITMMAIAFREKGRYSAINSMLAALGVQTEGEVEITDTVTKKTKTGVTRTEHYIEQLSKPSGSDIQNVTSKNKYQYTKIDWFCDSEWDTGPITSYIEWSLSSQMVNDPQPTSKEIGLQYNTYVQDTSKTKTVGDFTYYFYDVHTYTQVAKWGSTESIVTSDSEAPEDESRPDDLYGATYTTYKDQSEITLYDYNKLITEEYQYDSCDTTVTINIVSLDTPNVKYFIERLQELIPRLLWVHHLTEDGSTVQTVLVNVSLNKIYEKTMYETSLRFSDTVATLNYSNWGV